MFSTDPLFDNFAVVSIGLGLSGQPGEILAICAGIADGDDSGWYDAWSAIADRLTAEVDQSLATATAARLPATPICEPASTTQSQVPAVVDVAVQRPDVDPDRIALTGWSLGPNFRGTG